MPSETLQHGRRPGRREQHLTLVVWLVFLCYIDYIILETEDIQFGTFARFFGFGDDEQTDDTPESIERGLPVVC